ncbi:hypothetical protein ABK040_013287 [Willaertia magna]
MGSFSSKPKPKRVLLLGLDNSGKTSLLYSLSCGKFAQPIPTIGYNLEILVYKNYELNVFDVGGKQEIRSFWNVYYKGTDAVIFVIDGSDVSRFDEAKKELLKLVESEHLSDVPYLLFINKSDVKKCNLEELKRCLFTFHSISSKFVFPNSTKNRDREDMIKARDFLTVGNNLSPNNQYVVHSSVPPSPCGTEQEITEDEYTFFDGNILEFPYGEEQYLLQPCSVLDGTGLLEGFNWLRKYFVKEEKRKVPKQRRASTQTTTALINDRGEPSEIISVTNVNIQQSYTDNSNYALSAQVSPKN